MKTKFQNLRTYLPATKELYDQIAWNYLAKAVHDELYLGEYLVMRRCESGVGSSRWEIYYKDVLFLFMLPICSWGDSNHKLRFVFTVATNTKISTDKFLTFDIPTITFLKENFYYEYHILNSLIKHIRCYIVRIFDLATSIITYDYAGNHSIDKHNTIETINENNCVLDDKHIEICQYIRDAHTQQVALLEKREIDDFKELNVIEK